MSRPQASDADWEALASHDPLWAVITDERYRSERLTPEAEADFWRSGEAYVRHIADLCSVHFGQTLAPRCALDFGCGVGRLLVPLARLSSQAVGLDVSATMLTHAEAACARAGLSNVSFLSRLPTPQPFDFLNSALVLQHIPVERGLAVLSQLLDGLAPGGLLALQVLYARSGNSALRRAGRWLYASIPAVRPLLARRGTATPRTPYIQMNPYPLGRVFALLDTHGIGRLHAVLSSENGFRSALIVGQKSVMATLPGST